MTSENKPLDKDRANEIVAELSMPRFPYEARGRLGVVKAVLKMCQYEHQAEWLIGRMNDLFKEWPGISEMRAVYCSKWKPKDGIEVYSKAFPSGVPSEIKDKPLAIPATQRQAMIEGRKPEEELSFTKFVKDEDVIRVSTEAIAHRRLPPLPVNPITAEQIRQAEEEYRRSKGK